MDLLFPAGAFVLPPEQQHYPYPHPGELPPPYTVDPYQQQPSHFSVPALPKEEFAPDFEKRF